LENLVRGRVRPPRYAAGFRFTTMRKSIGRLSERGRRGARIVYFDYYFTEP